MVGAFILGLAIGLFAGCNVGVVLMGCLAAARDWPIDADAEN